MKGKKGQILLTIILIVLLGTFLFLAYMLYQNLPGEPKSLIAAFEQPELETGNLSYEVKQFYPNMKFNHNSISYKINSDCDSEKRARMIAAFNELEDKVSAISFYESNNPDIEVSCSAEEGDSVGRDFFIAGEGGAKEIIQTKRYNVITNGVVLLYDNPSNAIQCSWPNLELHELLHVFGFEHSSDENSLMYPYLESCSQKLDESIIQDLEELYSQENLADLYFAHVKAIKKGIYLDFNVTVRNSGVIDAEGVVLSVYDDKERIEDFDLRDISFGGGMNFQVFNIKLKNRNSDNIEIVIDPLNAIKELDEGNNVAKLEFA